MAALSFTPDHLLLDSSGRPYFRWDMELTLAAFLEALRDPDPEVRAYFAGKLMRQAKPVDVFRFLSLSEIGELWTRLHPYLGRSRAFWTWLLGEWRVVQRVGVPPE
ncbi:MAG: hypothetical protein HY721_02335 [Planctomycetes bacterium]|nr:hypothetical protein [Planctomycetota bacterium]